MAPLITLYILGGCVAAAAVLFIVMIVFSALRPPRLPELPGEPAPPLRRVIRALTPRAVPLVPATIGAPIDSMFGDEEPTTPARPHNAIKLVVGAQPPPVPGTRSAAPPRLPGVPPVPPSLPGVLSRSAVAEFEPARPMPPPRPAAPPPPPPALPARAAVPPAQSSKPSEPAPRSTTPSSARPMPESFAAAPALMPSRWSPEATSPGSFASQSSSVIAMRRLPVYPAHRGRTIARFIGALVATAVLASAIVIVRPSLLDPLCDELDWFGSDTAIALRDHARDANAAMEPYVAALLEPTTTEAP